MLLKVLKLIWEDIGIRGDFKYISAILLLHLHNVEAKSIFSGYFVAVRKMVDFLELVQSLIEV